MTLWRWKTRANSDKRPQEKADPMQKKYSGFVTFSKNLVRAFSLEGKRLSEQERGAESGTSEPGEQKQSSRVERSQQPVPNSLAHNKTHQQSQLRWETEQELQMRWTDGKTKAIRNQNAQLQQGGSPPVDTLQALVPELGQGIVFNLPLHCCLKWKVLQWEWILKNLKNILSMYGK